MSHWIFLGDSVTDCQRKRARRFQGQPDALGQGWVRYVAQKLAANGRDVDVWNRGYSGALTHELMHQVDWWPDQEGEPLTADLASLMIGINDVWHPFWKGTAHSIDASLEAYEHLISVLKSRARQVVLVEPVALPCGDVTQDWWGPLNELTAGQQKLAEAAGCLWVPMQEALMHDARGRYAEYLHDGVHPTDLGHRWLSIRWLRALEDAGYISESIP